MKINNQMVMDEEEVDSFLIQVKDKYGYDFRGYTRASLYRRINRFLVQKKLEGIQELGQYIFQSEANFEFFVQELTVNVTEMFRDPSAFVALRKKVLPLLSTYPYIKVWDSGCSTGEELYSLAILLEEENLLHRSKIYATDLNQKVLKKAKEGIVSAISIPQHTKNYYAAEGKNEFSNYYHSNYGQAKFRSELLKNVIFSPHNLATDNSFNEFNLIVCRNVLIYFNRELQDRVFNLFYESLNPFGYMMLGKKETISLSAHNKRFEVIDRENRIYRKIS